MYDEEIDRIALLSAHVFVGDKNIENYNEEENEKKNGQVLIGTAA